MKLKTFMLGSAIAFAIAGGAQAADLSVTEPLEHTYTQTYADAGVALKMAFGIGSVNCMNAQKVAVNADVNDLIQGQLSLPAMDQAATFLPIDDRNRKGDDSGSFKLDSVAMVIDKTRAMFGHAKPVTPAMLTNLYRIGHVTVAILGIGHGKLPGNYARAASSRARAKDQHEFGGGALPPPGTPPPPLIWRWF